MIRHPDFETREGRQFHASKVMLASTSPRRINYMQHMYDQTSVESFNHFYEEPLGEVLEVARGKVDVLEQRLRTQNMHKEIEGALGVAADTRTSVPVFNSIDGIILVSQGKQIDSYAVFKNFQNMDKVVRETGEEPFYQLDSGSIARLFSSNSQDSEAIQTLQVVLDRGGVDFLATRRGFERYLRAFKEFYSGPPYSNDNSGLSPHDLSAGLSLPVLMQLGLVSRINGVHFHNSEFIAKLRESIHIAAIGIPHQLLSPYTSTDTESRFASWPWIDIVTQRALETKELYD